VALRAPERPGHAFNPQKPDREFIAARPTRPSKPPVVYEWLLASLENLRRLISFFCFWFCYAWAAQACMPTRRGEMQGFLNVIPMPQDHSSRTSVTLLGRLRQDPKDQAAWNDFVARYQPQILKWCSRWGLKEPDAHDVTQAVLLKLSSLMANFAYDPSRSFRAWLKTLTHHAWRDLVAERKRAGIGSGDSRMGEFFASLEAGDDLVRHLEEEFERELMDQAMALVRPRVAPRTWDAFRLTALEGCTGAVAAVQLEMKVARVYVAKSEVKEMIRREIRKLEGTE
jgi:RNA polymerase sigma factor (sigma-70 family)